MWSFKTALRTVAWSVAVLSFTLPLGVIAQESRIQPVGEYANINTKLAMQTMQVLASGTDEEKDRVIAQIKSSPNKYSPPVFYALSHVLFQRGDQEDAAFWFYAGQLRARFDANRCADVTARGAVDALNQKYGPPINQYAFQHLSMLEQLIPKVVEWDKKTPHDYDQRWINLHGMNAVMGGLSANFNRTSVPSPPAAMSMPRDQWDQISENTREQYLSGFREAMARQHRQ